MHPTIAPIEPPLHAGVIPYILDLPEGAGVAVDLASESKKWLAECHRGLVDPNPLLDPATCETFVAWVHERYGASWSFGGYLEDRTHLWRGSYLDQSGSALHTALDINVPSGTPVRAGVFGTIVVAESDAPMIGGWGAHVVIDPLNFSHVFLFAHLSANLPSVGVKTSPATIIGQIGSSPDNGVWFAHLHLQAIERDHFYGCYAGSTKTMDGYVCKEDEARYQPIFPEPLAVLAACRRQQLGENRT